MSARNLKHGKAIHHPEENGHYYEHGDISGVGKHLVQENDGTNHYEITLWPNGVIPYTIKGPYSRTI